jgi:hypothetical protein
MTNKHRKILKIIFQKSLFNKQIHPNKFSEKERVCTLNFQDRSKERELETFEFESRERRTLGCCWYEGCQFRSVSPGMAETFHTNSKNETKRNNFHLILNLGPFRIFQLNFGRNVPVSFHMFRSALEKSLNKIEPYSI